MATTKPRTCRRTIVLAAVYGRTTADYLVEVEA